VLQKREQDHSKATFTRLLTKEQGFLPYPIVQKILRGEPLTESEIPPITAEYYKKYPPLTTSHYPLTTYFNLYRALSPWPGLWTMLPLKEGEKRLKITKMELKGGKPTITQVQLEGKKISSFQQFNNHYKII
jgi:methionyl-tRNA formyltransferase